MRWYQLVMRVRLVQSLRHAERAVQHLSSSPLLGVDCEGVALGRFGRLCTVQMMPIKPRREEPPNHSASPVYLFDCEAPELCSTLPELLRPLLSSKSTLKVMHDCREDAAVLRAQWGVELNNVFDTQVAQALVEPANAHSGFMDALKFFEEGKAAVDGGGDPPAPGSEGGPPVVVGGAVVGESRKDLRAMEDLCLRMKTAMARDDRLWVHRPFSHDLLRYAVHGCVSLGDLFDRQIDHFRTSKRLVGAGALHQRLAAESWVVEDLLLPQETGRSTTLTSVHSSGRHDYPAQEELLSSTVPVPPRFPANPIKHVISRTADAYLPYAAMNVDLFPRPKDAAKIGTPLLALCAAKTDSAIYFKLNLGRCGVVSTPSALARMRGTKIGDFLRCIVSGVSLTGEFLFLDQFDENWNFHEYRQRPLDLQANKKHLEIFSDREHRHKPDLFSARAGVVDPLLTSRCAEVFEEEEGWC